MLDLFSGTGCASRAALVRGWDVVRVDVAEGTACDVRCDVRTFDPFTEMTRCTGCGSLDHPRAVRGLDGCAHCNPCCPDCSHPMQPFDLVWASPPCNAFSSANQRTRDVSSGMDLVHAALRVIKDCKPRWWVLENVHGATRAIGEVLGPPVARYGSFYLWGVFPPFDAQVQRSKTKLSGRRRAERRAAIPYAISDGLVRACEALAVELGDRRGAARGELGPRPGLEPVPAGTKSEHKSSE